MPYTFIDGVLTINENIEVITEQMIYENDIKKVIIPGTVKSIEVAAFYDKGIEEVEINEGVTEIKASAFAKNSLKKITLPNSLEKIGKSVFRDNQITEIHLPDSLIELPNSAFENNKIVNLILPSQLISLGERAFKKNKLEKIIFNDKLTTISKKAFAKNKLNNLIIPDCVTTIEEKAFSKADIRSLMLGKNVQTIKDAAFHGNILRNVHFNDQLTTIGNDAFSENLLTDIILPDSLKEIGNYAFKECELKNVQLPKYLEMLGVGAFTHNTLKTIDLPSSLESISPETFAMNNLIEIILPSSIKTIGYDAFCGNYLTTIDLRYVSHIGANSFSDNFITEAQINPDLQGMGLYAFGKKNPDFIVNNSKLPSKLVKRYSSKLIPKVLFIQKTLPHFNFDLTNSKVLELLPYDLKIIKAYNSNVKKVNNYLQKYSNLQSNEEPLFKLAFALGLYNGYDNFKVLDKFLKNTSLNSLKDIFKDVEITNYNPKIIPILNTFNAMHNEVNQNHRVLISLFTNFKEIDKHIIARKEQQIADINTLRKKAETPTQEEKIMLQLECLKKNKKNTTLNDLEEFIQNTIYSFKDNQLKAITFELAENIEPYDFPFIEEIYQNHAKEHYLKSIKEDNENYHFEWLDSNDNLNLVLGYRVDCCAKLNGQGEDIMIQSIQNPRIKNLVVYNQAKKVIAKTTVFYNHDYLLGNNIEVCKQFQESIKVSKEDKIAVLEAFKRGLLAQKDYLEANGLDIQFIRIGMGHNGLTDIIKEDKMPVIKNYLLPNYRFDGYMGDANSYLDGQVQIYKK